MIIHVKDILEFCLVRTPVKLSYLKYDATHYEQWWYLCYSVINVTAHLVFTPKATIKREMAPRLQISVLWHGLMKRFWKNEGSEGPRKKKRTRQTLMNNLIGTRLMGRTKWGLAQGTRGDLISRASWKWSVPRLIQDSAMRDWKIAQASYSSLQFLLKFNTSQQTSAAPARSLSLPLSLCVYSGRSHTQEASSNIWVFYVKYTHHTRAYGKETCTVNAHMHAHK